MDKRTPDVRLPAYVLWLGIFVEAIALFLVVIAILNVFMPPIDSLIFAAVAGVLGVFAFLCYFNQKIWIVGGSSFEYSTMFGNRRTYSFDEITRIKHNADSMTVFIGREKVHIEACAVVSPEFQSRIDGVYVRLAEQDTRLH